MTRLIGVAVGVLLGLAAPVCAGDTSAELVIIAVDQEGRHLWSRTQTFETYSACQIARAELMMQYWQAMDNPIDPFRQGLKSKCYQRA